MWVRTGLCEPALVAALLLILWIRMLPQLLRGRLEKLVPSEQLLVTLMFKISGRDRNPSQATWPPPRDCQVLKKIGVSGKLVER